MIVGAAFMELIRSLIFVPGNRANMLERARSFNVDIVMVDLEDSVPPDEKTNARGLAAEWVPTLRGEGQRVMVRVNSLDTGLVGDDLRAVVATGLYGVSLGKVESAWHVQDLAQLLGALESAAGIEFGSLKIIPWIESAQAVWGAKEIATASQRVVAIAFGAEDYTNDMGIERTDSGDEVYVARAMVPIAARAAGVASLDSPFVGFQDPDALRADAGRGRQMGYTGKFAIHPAQLGIINEVFSPAAEEIAYARRVMEAWEQATSAGRGSLALDGRMVDVPVVKRAQNLLALADEIEARAKA